MGVYCDAEDVAQMLQTENEFTTGTPTRETVERIIESVEDEIDHQMKHAWRERRTANEYQTARWDPAFRYAIPVPFVELDHWEIRTLASTNKDKLEVWNGSTYVDWLTAGKTEGRAADYFLQARMGRIYFMRGFPIVWRYPDGVRVTYRYGDFDVTGDVHDLATMMAARKIALMDHRVHIAAGGPEAPQSVSPADIVADLDKQIVRKLANTSWIRSPRPLWRLSGGPQGR